MLDNIKFRIKDKTVINKLLLHSDFTPLYSRVNSLAKYKHKDIGAKLHFELKKEFVNGQFAGYEFADLCISPHYYFNQYRHNGNDFTPENCINSVYDILTYIGIKPNEFNALKVVNLEFGLNLIPETDIKTIINGLLFYGKTPFKVGNFPYFKKTDATAYKFIKAYAKGLQFIEVPEYGIHPNTFRFEIKTKEAKYLRTDEIRIYNATDLLKLDTYSRLGQTLLNEWENVLITNLTPDLKGLKSDEVKYLTNAKTFDFWQGIITKKHRNTFGINKVKYFKILQGKNNLHTQIKLQIIDKLFTFSKCANSTQRTPINRGKVQNSKNTLTLINVENAHFNKCLVTGLDISMQKTSSKFLCHSGLKYYKENKPTIYKELEKKYLKDKQRSESEERQIYLICKNIRDVDSNPRNNRKQFEKRNYHPNQLQFRFL